MDATGTGAAPPGLRERKKQRTRETIVRAALELVAAHGYTNTTLEDIAAAAEVSTGTLFAYFPSKEDILFPEERAFFEKLQQRLEDRPSEATTFDVLRDLLPTLEPPDGTLSLRLRILQQEGLRDKHRARFTRVERLLAQSIAQDLDTTPDDLRPTLLAASTSAALAKLGERFQPETGKPVALDDALRILEQMLTVLRSGLNELTPADE